MRLTTVNLWNGRASSADLHRLVGELQPDLLAAQEVGLDAADVLSVAFPHGTVHGARDITGKALVSGCPIGVEEVPIPFRPGLRTVVGGVDVFAVHITNPISGPWAWRARRAQVEYLRAVTGDLPRVVVVGDMNATPAWPVYRRLASVLDDGVASWARRAGTRLRPTWTRFPSLPMLLRIDHVFVRGVEVTGVRLDRLVGGDHSAVTVDLAIP